MVLLIISIIVFIVLILLLVPIYLNIKIQRENENDNVEFKIFLLKGLIKFGVELPFLDIILAGNQPSIEVKEKEEANEKDVSENKHILSIKEILKSIEQGLHVKTTILVITRYLVRKIRIIKFVWRTSIGLEDAAITGVLSGGLWSIKGFILSFILNNKEIEDLRLKVIPHFNKNIFETYFDCIIKLRLVYIIIAGLYGLKVKLKGGEVDE